MNSKFLTSSFLCIGLSSGLLYGLDFHPNVDKQEKNEVMKILSKAGKGDKKAQYKLAEQYLGGSLKPNNQEAKKWLSLSAQQGYAPAQAWLGFLYLQGHDVNHDYNKALNLLLLSAKTKECHWSYDYVMEDEIVPESGNSFSNYDSLSTIYEKGLGVPKDLKKAKMYEGYSSKRCPRSEGADYF